MRDFLFKLFEMSHFNTGIQITPFSIAHIVYLVLIFGGIIGGWLLMRGKSVPADPCLRTDRILHFRFLFP